MLAPSSLDCLQLCAAEELTLSHCVTLSPPTLSAAVRRAPKLLSLSLRGLDLRGVLEALEEEGNPGLGALDLGFTSGLSSEAVLSLLRARPALVRCSLRGAKQVRRAAYATRVQPLVGGKFKLCRGRRRVHR